MNRHEFEADKHQHKMEEEEQYYFYNEAVKLADKNGKTDIVKVDCYSTFENIKEELQMRNEFFFYMNNPKASDDWRAGIRTESGTCYFWISPYISSPSQPAF
jgi:hypothetical protein